MVRCLMVILKLSYLDMVSGKLKFFFVSKMTLLTRIIFPESEFDHEEYYGTCAIYSIDSFLLFGITPVDTHTQITVVLGKKSKDINSFATLCEAIDIIDKIQFVKSEMLVFVTIQKGDKISFIRSWCKKQITLISDKKIVNDMCKPTQKDKDFHEPEMSRCLDLHKEFVMNSSY
jgi:hypothetical protein